MEWSKTRLISSLDSLRVIWLEAVAVSVRLWLLVSRLEERSRRVLKNGCSRQSSKEPATKSVRFRLSPSQAQGCFCCWLPRGKMKNLPEKVMSDKACFSRVAAVCTGWLAKLRSRFHPKKFLLKCWCWYCSAAAAWDADDFWLNWCSGLSWYLAAVAADDYHPPARTPNLLAELRLLN